MKINVGDKIKNDVFKSKIPKTQIAKDLGISRAWLHSILEDDMMEVDYIHGIGKIIKKDYSLEFPDVGKKKFDNILEDPSSPYGAMTVIELKNKIIEIQEKYTKLLEAYIELQNKHLK